LYDPTLKSLTSSQFANIFGSASRIANFSSPPSNFASCEASKLESDQLRVVNTGVIDKAIKTRAELSGPLAAWLKIAKEEAWAGLNDIRKTWPKTDAVDERYIFNIKGNNYRLIATINFRSQTLFVEHVLTHAEYDKGGWK
jgi:mRNA interferase HigB